MNDYSHNSYPISAIEHMPKKEIQSVIETLLDIVKRSDLQHYEILEKVCSIKD